MPETTVRVVVTMSETLRRLCELEASRVGVGLPEWLRYRAVDGLSAASLPRAPKAKGGNR